jgi:hypothetical protein
MERIKKPFVSSVTAGFVFFLLGRSSFLSHGISDSVSPSLYIHTIFSLTPAHSIYHISFETFFLLVIQTM